MKETQKGVRQSNRMLYFMYISILFIDNHELHCSAQRNVNQQWHIYSGFSIYPDALNMALEETTDNIERHTTK